MKKTISQESGCDVLDLEEILFKLTCNVDIVGALQEALSLGNYDKETYANAAFATYNHLCELLGELREIVDRGFEAMRKQ